MYVAVLSFVRQVAESVTNIHFASATPHAKCNNCVRSKSCVNKTQKLQIAITAF